MTEINDLEGYELSEIVAKMRGMKPLQHGWWWDYSRGYAVFIGDEYPTLIERPDNFYRPDLDISQAWELDEDGWEWSSMEYPHWENGDNHYDDMRLELVVERSGADPIPITSVAFNDFSTKAHAYATARCRVYLLAKGYPND